MIDQFIISPFQEYSGSMPDGVYYGNILSNNASIQATTIEGSPVSESIDPFQRTRIWSKSSGDASTELRKRNILYSDRIKYIEELEVAIQTLIDLLATTNKDSHKSMAFL